MNKISKKIVALVTMAAFVLTLVPAAAFAADNNASVNASKITIDGSTEVEVVAGDKETISFTVNNASGIGTTDNLADKAGDVKLWVTDGAGNFAPDAVTFGSNVEVCGTNNNMYKIESAVDNYTTVDVTFNREGTFYIYAGVGAIQSGATPDTSVDYGFAYLNEKTPIKVTVAPADFEVAQLVLQNDNNYTIATFDNENDVAEIEINDVLDANGTDVYTVTGYAYRDDNQTPVPEGTEVTLTSGDGENLQFVATKSGTMETTTSNLGKFTFSFTMNDKRDVPVFINVAGQEYTLRVLGEEVSPYDIDVASDGGYVLAGTDEEHWNNFTNRWLSDAVQFTITDVAGNPITGDISDIEPAASFDTTTVAHAKNVRVVDQPKDLLDAEDFVLVPDGDQYTLYYTGEQSNLIPGTYSVRVALESGDYATATFHVAKYGTTKSFEIDLYGHEYMTNPSVTPSEEWTKLDGEVTLGQTVMAVGTYVDENGIKIAATDAVFGFNGDAKRQDTHYANNFFATEEDIEANESLLGSSITVTGFDPKTGIGATVELTVVDSYYTKDLAFDPTEGPVNTDNEVTVSVVDADGNVAKVEGEIYAYLVDQSNEDAKVTVTANKKWGHDVANGKGSLTIYATADTEVEVAVYVKAGTEIYAGNLKYTVGDGDIVAHHNVTMTIGSSQYVVDKQLFTMDAAPYVDSNWRTMVPIRELAEGFDAEVIWDNDARTVTINYNEQTIVMTIDETTYTVNDEEMTMDTEPVIQGDRTYVPIRFAAEAMGFEVTPLYNADGLTSSVVFQS